MTTPQKRTAPCLTHTRRLKRESNASESLILRREFTREEPRARFRSCASPERPVRVPFPRASLRHFTGAPERLLALLEADWRPQRLRGAA